MARTYNKKNQAYWESRKRQEVVAQPVVAPAPQPRERIPTPDIIYGSTDMSAYRQAAGGSNCDTTNSPNAGRPRQLNNGLVDEGAYQNLLAMPATYVGYNGGRQYMGMQLPILLCNKAYAGVSIFRNAVEVLTEFSSQPLYIKTENATVKEFFTEWFNACQLYDFKRQFFREYYRSGNVFLYKFSGRFGPAYYQGYQQMWGAKNNTIPIRYELLNPSNIFVPTGLTAPYTYAQLMSTYDLDRLRNPMTEQDKQVYQQLPQQVKDQLKGGSANPMGVWIPLDPKRLRYAFYKKQSYEALAVPMGYPIMADIEWKLALKKMDMAVARTVEHFILLVTTGEPVNSEGYGGINQGNIARLQNLFANQSIGRVLVADYTTKANWLVPDIDKILGPEKYAIVDKDIREGLQSLLGGVDEKFANAQLKAKVFIERLVEGQNVFLSQFLMPEITQICQDMGFRDVPVIEFGKIDLQDEAIMSRIYTQLAQIGVLTADETVEAINSGILPDQDQMLRDQKRYKKEREDGLFEPLIGGAKDKEGAGPNGRPAGSGTPQSTKSVSPIGTSKGAFSMVKVLENTRAYESLAKEVASHLKKRFKVKQLNEAQTNVIDQLANLIMVTQPREKWNDSVAAVVKAPPQLSVEQAKELDDIRAEYECTSWEAALLLNSRREAPESA